VVGCPVPYRHPVVPTALRSQSHAKMFKISKLHECCPRKRQNELANPLFLGYFTNQLVNLLIMTPASHPDAQAERSAETRGRILDAALSEFAANGLAGARTEQIAQAAGVNKALLYYYFESKEKLYSTALETVAGRVRDRSMAVFLRDATPGERMLRAALDHFDRILTQREFQSLLQ